MYALFMVPKEIKPKGLRLYCIFNRNYNNGRYVDGRYVEDQPKKVEILVPFSRVQVGNEIVADGLTPELLSGFRVTDHVQIIPKETSQVKEYNGSIMSINKTQLSLREEGKDTSLVTIPIDNIAKITKIDVITKTKVIWLLGGDSVKAVDIKDYGDIYLIKNQAGKTQRLEKKDVSKIEDEDKVKE